MDKGDDFVITVNPEHKACELAANITKMFKDQEYEKIDGLLYNLDRSMCILSMLTLLNTTYADRDILENWDYCLASVREELDNRGENSTQILRGLDYDTNNR